MLSPCSSCRRHLKRTETVCPFCATPVASTVAEPAPAPLASGRGLKRATLFAVGVSLAAACEPDNSVAIYGAPVPPNAGSGGVGGQDNTGGRAGNAGTAGSAGRGGAGGTAGDGAAGASDEPADASAPRDAAADDAGDAAP